MNARSCSAPVFLAGVATSFVILACFAPSAAKAQPVLAPNTPSTPAATMPSNASTTKRGLSAKSLFEDAQSRSLPLAKWGPLSVRPHVLYRIIHADGLLNPQQSEDSSSVVQTVAPGVLFEVGDNVTFDYTYSRTHHSNAIFRSEADHDARLAASFRRGRWSGVIAQRYTSNSPVLVETGRQTPQDSFVTDLNVSLQLGQRTQLSTNVAVSSRQVSEVSTDPQWTTADWRSWSLTEYLEYEISPRMNLGIGFSAGYDEVTPGDDMAHTQPQGRIAWRPTDKISLAVTAGLENRTFKGSNSTDLENPVYRANITYAPFHTTKVGFAGSRSFGASYFANLASRTSGWSATLEQRLVKRLYLNADYSDQQTSYVFSGDGPYSGRKDKVQSITARLSTPFLRHGSISLIYQTGKNTSTAPGFSLDSEQFGAETTYRF